MIRFLKVALNVLRIASKLNLIHTIYFNFKVLPFHQAFKLPFHFYGKTDFAKLTGEFKISSNELHFGMIVFGAKHEVVITSNVPTRIYNSGKIEFIGKAQFARGVNLMVWDHAHVLIGHNFSVGSLSKIISFRNLQFGNNVLISWECQIFDTDFHFVINEGMQITDNCSDILINDDVWIGTRATILKGTKLARNSIVAANSLCSGNYSEKYGEGVLLAGIPAKGIKKGVAYLTNKQREMELFQYFANHPNSETNWKQ